jgi:hypothetical protein
MKRLQKTRLPRLPSCRRRASADGDRYRHDGGDDALESATSRRRPRRGRRKGQALGWGQRVLHPEPATRCPRAARLERRQRRSGLGHLADRRAAAAVAPDPRG